MDKFLVQGGGYQALSHSPQRNKNNLKNALKRSKLLSMYKPFDMKEVVRRVKTLLKQNGVKFTFMNRFSDV